MARRSSDRGLALLMALWAAVVLGLLAGSLNHLSRGDLRIARNMGDAAEAELAADAAVWLALQSLAEGTEDGMRPDGAIRAFRYAGSTIRVSASDEAGRIDVNFASAELVSALLLAAGLGPVDAAELGEALVRERVERLRLLTAAAGEAEEAASGRFLRAFASVEDALLWAGLEPATRARVAQALTVETGVGGPDPEVAPLLVRAALEGRTAEAALPPPERRVGPIAAGLVRIHAEALTDKGAHAARDAVFALVNDRGGQQVELRAWRRGARRHFPLR